MSSPDNELRTSYAFCRRLAQSSGSSFYASFLKLPPAKRNAMDALYAFMRHTDDLADQIHKPLQTRHEALSQWRSVLHSALHNGSASWQVPSSPSAFSPCYAEPAGLALLPALADTIRRFQVPPEHLMAVIDGVEMDLTRHRYANFEQLEQYCQRVASAVGLACIHVWGFRDPQALEPARQCGIAMQLTNILRDIREDAAQDRVYVPLADLQHYGLTIEDWLAGVADQRFDRLMDYQIARAEAFYHQGERLMNWLETDAQRVFGMMMATYRALLNRIKQSPRAVLRRRVSLSRPEKLRIAARWMLLPPRAIVWR